ncbi:MAG: AraC family transcriptional regulator [Planctomycetota bacterium]|nr:AraC family transcriptional regulator [Planctomycetota bacterium]
MDNPASPRSVNLLRITGLASEQARRLGWYVHNGAHVRCGPEFGCARESFFGHQIMFMLGGRGTGMYRGVPFTASGGQAVLMDLRQPHAYFAQPDDPWEMYWVRFDGPGVAASFTALLSAAGSCVMPFADRARLDEDFRALARLLADLPPGYDAWVYARLAALVANVVEGLRRAGNEKLGRVEISGAAPEGIAAAREHLHFNHQRTLAVAELARVAHMSEYHFIRRFKGATGFTPMEYLEKFRVGRAQELILTQPELRLGEVARAVGYEDPAYFSRVFRKRVGLSPRAYREQEGPQSG